MQRNHHIAKRISVQGWYQFKIMPTYKMEWGKADLIIIGRFEHSSKTCSKCANIRYGLKLPDRICHCDACGLTMDRALNAAINILRMELVKAGKGMPEYTPVESATVAELSKGGLQVATL